MLPVKLYWGLSNAAMLRARPVWRVLSTPLALGPGDNPGVSPPPRAPEGDGDNPGDTGADHSKEFSDFCSSNFIARSAFFRLLASSFRHASSNFCTLYSVASSLSSKMFPSVLSYRLPIENSVTVTDPSETLLTLWTNISSSKVLNLKEHRATCSLNFYE